MSDEEQEVKDMDMVREAALKLSDHFDAVQIFASRHESSKGGTVSAKFGVGNWFARYGQVLDWTTKENEGAREEIRRQDDT